MPCIWGVWCLLPHWCFISFMGICQVPAAPTHGMLGHIGLAQNLTVKQFEEARLLWRDVWIEVETARFPGEAQDTVEVGWTWVNQFRLLRDTEKHVEVTTPIFFSLPSGGPLATHLPWVLTSSERSQPLGQALGFAFEAGWWSHSTPLDITDLSDLSGSSECRGCWILCRCWMDECSSRSYKHMKRERRKPSPNATSRLKGRNRQNSFRILSREGGSNALPHINTHRKNEHIVFIQSLYDIYILYKIILYLYIIYI